MIEWIVLILAVVVLAMIAAMYNGFIVLKTQMENSWAQIDVQTKRRFDLIPNLVETVKAMQSTKRTLSLP